MSRRRRRLLGVAAFVVVLALCVWGYDRATSPRRWLVGAYTSTRLDGEETVTLRLAADGSAVMECRDAVRPAAYLTRVVGRWRLAGRVLSLETGESALAPVGVAQHLFERFEPPTDTRGRGLLRSRVVSADAGGLTLDLGDREWRLERAVPDAEPDGVLSRDHFPPS